MPSRQDAAPTSNAAVAQRSRQGALHLRHYGEEDRLTAACCCSAFFCASANAAGLPSALRADVCRPATLASDRTSFLWSEVRMPRTHRPLSVRLATNFTLWSGREDDHQRYALMFVGRLRLPRIEHLVYGRRLELLRKAATGRYRFRVNTLVGARGFEPPTPCTPCKCATRLRHAPTLCVDCSARRLARREANDTEAVRHAKALPLPRARRCSGMAVSPFGR